MFTGTPAKIVGPWRKASKSGGNGGNCVLVAVTENGGRAVKHSKDFTNPGNIQFYTREEWDAFLDGAKRGEFE